MSTAHPNDARPLNDREQRFVDALVLLEVQKKRGAQTRAAIAAGFSEKSARFQGSKLATRSNIRAAIEARKAELAAEAEKRFRVDGEAVIRALALRAFGDTRRAYDEFGRLLPPDLWPDDVAALVASIEIVDGVDAGAGQQLSLAFPGPNGQPLRVALATKRVRFHDQLRALELLGRHLKLWDADNQLPSNITLNVTNPYAAPQEPKP